VFFDIFIIKNIMAKIIRLTESDLARIVKRVIKEENECGLTGKVFEFNADGEVIKAKALSEPYVTKYLTTDEAKAAGAKVGDVIPNLWLVLFITVGENAGRKYEVGYDCRTKNLNATWAMKTISPNFAAAVAYCKCR